MPHPVHAPQAPPSPPPSWLLTHTLFGGPHELHATVTLTDHRRGDGGPVSRAQLQLRWRRRSWAPPPEPRRPTQPLTLHPGRGGAAQRSAVFTAPGLRPPHPNFRAPDHLQRLRTSELRVPTQPTWHAAGHAEERHAHAEAIRALLAWQITQARAPLAAFAAPLRPPPLQAGPVSARLPALREALFHENLLTDAALTWILHGRFDPPDFRAPLTWRGRASL